MELSIIIVNYNVKYYLAQCLDSVLKATAALDAEIIVIDNASSDGSVDYLQPKFPQVTFIINNNNRGFGAANNQAATLAKGEYLLILNPDTVIPEDGLQACLKFMKSKPEVGALGVRMIDGFGHFLKESKRGFPSPATAFYKMSGLINAFPTSARFGKYYLGHLPEKKSAEVDVLAGAFMLIKTRVWQELNGFDEDYFMFGEDIDLSYRIIKAGYKNYYFPDVSILHYKGESSNRQSKAFVKMFYEAMQIFSQKHFKQSYKRPTYFFIRTAIKGSSTLALSKNWLISNNKTQKHSAQSIVIADSRYIDEIKSGQLINPQTIAAFISPADNDFEPDLYHGHLKRLSTINSASKKQLIFWKDSLSYKAIINIMDQYKSRFDYVHCTLENILLPQPG